LSSADGVAAEVSIVDHVKANKALSRPTGSHFSPAKEAEWPEAMGVTLRFGEASGTHLGLGRLLGRLNATKTPAWSNGHSYERAAEL